MYCSDTEKHTECNSVLQGRNGWSSEDKQAQRQVSLLSDDQQDVQRGEQEYSSQRGSAHRGIHVPQRWGGILLWGEVKLNGKKKNWFYTGIACHEMDSCESFIHGPRGANICKFRLTFLAYLNFGALSFTASRHQVPLLRPGRGGLLSERQVVVRRCPHETVQDSDADTSRQDAGHHGQTQRVPNCVTLKINTRLLCTHTPTIFRFMDVLCY